jgi:hypothetical protein
MTPKRRKRNPEKRSSPAVPTGIGFQLAVFLIAFLIVFSRRPDAILHATFFAEDGSVWYPQAQQFGLHTFVMPYAGYVHTLVRSVALLALLFPFALAPVVMNLCAIVVQILPVNIFLSSRFSQIPFKMRLLGSFVYLALPQTREIHANITNVQWHLGLVACLILLAQPDDRRGWKIFDAVVLVLTSISTPIAVLLLPVATAMWWKRRQRWSAISLALTIPGALVETLFALFSHTRTADLNGPTLRFFSGIVGRQVFFSALLGLKSQLSLTPGDGLVVLEAVSTAIGLALVCYTLFYAPFELRVFVLFCSSVLALGLWHPLAGPPGYPQWGYMYVPGRASRYYFFPMLAFLASLFWIGIYAPHRYLRYFALVLLIMLPIGVFQDWWFPPLRT